MQKKWTIKEIKEGFERFYKKYGRLPLAPEIDQTEYLPSCRQIQRRFGGLEKLRVLLGYRDTHFGRGKHRSKIAKRSNLKGRETEIKLEKMLREKFHEVFVHTEKVFDYSTKNRVDFFIYSPDGNFGIDVFYTSTMKDLQKNVNIKIDKYKKFPYKLFLVVANSNFNQRELNEYSKNKKKVLPKNFSIVTLETFLKIIKNKRSYPDPLTKKNF